MQYDDLDKTQYSNRPTDRVIVMQGPHFWTERVSNGMTAELHHQSLDKHTHKPIYPRSDSSIIDKVV